MTRAQKSKDPVTFEECGPFLHANREDTLPVKDLLRAINAARTTALPPREETSQGALTTFLMGEVSKMHPRIGVVTGRRNGYYLLQTLPAQTQTAATTAEPPTPSPASPAPKPMPVTSSEEEKNLLLWEIWELHPSPRDEKRWQELCAMDVPSLEALLPGLRNRKEALEEGKQQRRQQEIDAVANPLREQLAKVQAELDLANAKANNLNECWNEATGKLEVALQEARDLREQLKKLGADLAASKKRVHVLEEAQKKPVEVAADATAPAVSATPSATSGSEPGPVVETPELRSEMLTSPLRVDRRGPNAVVRFLSNKITIAAMVAVAIIGGAILAPKAFQGTKSEEGKQETQQSVQQQSEQDGLDSETKQFLEQLKAL